MKNLLVVITLCGLTSVILFLYPLFQTKIAVSPLSMPQKQIDSLTPEMTTIQKVSLEEMLGSLFMVGHWAYTPQASTSALIAQEHVGGVIIMSVPEKIAEVKEWTTSWQILSSSTLLIATDQEGGVVQRIKGAGYTATAQRDIVDEDHAYTVARKRGDELRELGINMNFAPVLDSAHNTLSFMYKRAFREASTSHYFADAMIHGFEDAGVIAVPKHFPGHADTSDDSHFKLPLVPIEKNALGLFIAPFARLLKTHPPKGLMTAHVLFPKIDNRPATLSKFFLTDYLRNSLSFEGVIVTDDITMDAIDKTYSTEEATILALEAGADLILFAAEPERVRSAQQAVVRAVESGRLSRERVTESYLRIQKLKMGAVR